VKALRLMIASSLGALFAVVGVSAGQNAAATAPYPPQFCPTIAVSTTTPFPGEVITVTGSGFKADQSLTLVLQPSPVTTLAHVTADSSGAFSTRITLPAGASGSHVIVADGSGSSCPVDPIQIQVAGTSHSPSGGGGLASTGVDILVAVAVALSLICAGLVLTRGGRRRHRSAHAGRH
jgi:hypothetical protein